MNQEPDSQFVQPLSSPTNNARRIVIWILTAVLLIILCIAGWYSWAYTQTAPSLRHPQQTHAHVRLQIINSGKPVDFSIDSFQKPYDKFSCSVALPEEPIHFHDNLDQFAHLHWKGITGGMLLKFYGWNHTGGADTRLGYRFDRGWRPRAVPIHNKLLPQVDQNAKYYIYTGDKTGYTARNWSEFLTQDLETFFAAEAQHAETEPDNTSSTAAVMDNTESQLTSLAQVLGNVVIFAQANQPTETEAQARFNNLIPLPKSTCGG